VAGFVEADGSKRSKVALTWLVVLARNLPKSKEDPERDRSVL